jgi:hypothetical protein
MASKASEASKEIGHKNPVLSPQSPLFWQKQNCKHCSFYQENSINDVKNLTADPRNIISHLPF